LKAAKISQTVELENPPNAHCIDALGVGSTTNSNADAVTPIRPIAAAGMGPMINPKTTAANIAKKCQALGASPFGTGMRVMVIPTHRGIAAFKTIVFISCIPLINQIRQGDLTSGTSFPVGKILPEIHTIAGQSEWQRSLKQ
jgi:hypothetical protein